LYCSHEDAPANQQRPLSSRSTHVPGIECNHQGTTKGTREKAPTEHIPYDSTAIATTVVVVQRTKRTPDEKWIRNTKIPASGASSETCSHEKLFSIGNRNAPGRYRAPGFIDGVFLARAFAALILQTELQDEEP
jgi:hypothetical protein